MVRKIVLVVLAVFGIGVAMVSTQTTRTPYHTPKTQVQITSDKDRDAFQKRLTSILNKANTDVYADYKKGNYSPKSPYAKIFAQNVFSPTSDTLATFNPVITNGGLNELGDGFVVVVNNGSSRDDMKRDFMVSGDVSENGTISNVKVVQL